jgi:choice-of-anchor B domain-containing protein
MTNKFLLLSFLMSFSITALSQQKSFNTELLSSVSFGTENSNDIWGYIDDNGINYAIIGNARNTRVFSLEDPKQPILRHTAPGAQSVWRDIKSYNKHLYVTTDQGTDGLVIIDMTNAPAQISHIYYKPELNVNNNIKNLERCHNIYIDEKGYAYLSGCNISKRGVLIFDLKGDPKAPAYVGAADLNYAHDAYARGDTLYASEINVGQLAIYDIADRGNPKLMATRLTSKTFTHNAWISDDGKYVFTTDERANAYVDAYDISDLNDIRLLDQFRPLEREGQGVIPHNTHYYKGFLLTSWYTDGLRIVDAHRPDNLVEIAYYDTWEDPVTCHNGFSGCWGAYPFTGTDLAYASDINNGLFIVKVDYKRAAYLEGKVTDEAGNAINNALVTIKSGQINRKYSNAAGNYKTGHAFEGNFVVEVRHPDFAVENVTLNFKAGEVTSFDFILKKPTFISYSGKISTEDNKAVQTKIKISGLNYQGELQTDNQGQFTVSIPQGEYDIHVSAWGYKPYYSTKTLSGSESLNITMQKGYSDHFNSDLGWSVNSTENMTGEWERAIPNATYHIDNLPANAGNDDVGDQGDFCFVTGNGLRGAGCDDVDNGITRISSPVMDLTGYNNPVLNFSWWLFIAGGNTPKDDSLSVYISNGDKEVLAFRTGTSISAWDRTENIFIKQLIELSSTMQIHVEIGDRQQTGHLVEAAFDNFSVSEGISGLAETKDMVNELSVYPNPSFDKIRVNGKTHSTLSEIFITDIVGKTVYRGIYQAQREIDIEFLEKGIYFVHDKFGNSAKFLKL